VLGAIHLLELNPDAAWLQTKKQTLEQLLQGNGGGSRRARQLRALLDLRLGSPQELAASAQAWAEADPNHPDALLCRFQSRVMIDDFTESSRLRVAIEGVQVVQASADQGAARERLRRVLAQETQRSDPERQKRIQAVLATFKLDGQ